MKKKILIEFSQDEYSALENIIYNLKENIEFENKHGNKIYNIYEDFKRLKDILDL